MMGVGEFEEHRPALFGMAYRMLGDRAAAEDMVQQTFLRARQTANVEAPRAWLTTVVTRLCLDHLKSAQARREQYVGPWLPEPLPTEEMPDPLMTRETISMAFLIVLDTLSPVERAVFVLHDVFDYRHAEVAEILGKEETTVRQILHRAKAHVRERRPRFAGSREQHQRLLAGFVNACMEGEVEAFKQVLADDVVATSDGGGKRQAARRPVAGADKVARMLLGLAAKNGATLAYQIRNLNGEPAIVGWAGGAVENVLTIATDGLRITAVNIVRNPDKLARLTP
jgi:RNA polymerase sigma-70 factor (ECF subfamily)